MANVFKRFTEVVNKPNRATYDLSFQNNLTLKFGTLYPVFCKEVINGDSLRIKPTFNFNFMPFVSPVQTRMKANLHFFYVRNRPHWKDYMDWEGMTKDNLVHPYIKLNATNRDMFTTGSIGDYLGIPTKIFGQVNRKLSFNPKFARITLSNGIYSEEVTNNNADCLYCDLSDSQWSEPLMFNEDFKNGDGYRNCLTSLIPVDDYINKSGQFTIKRFSFIYRCRVAIFNTLGVAVYLSPDFIPVEGDFTFDNPINDDWYVDSVTRRPDLLFAIIPSENYLMDEISSIEFVFPESEELDVKDLSLSELPWCSDGNPDGLRINAFPFRAYEAIYNSFYRDDRNNPRIVNGQPEYNKYITTDEGGADTTHYKLYQRNWEPDYLTTAVQSPQQGIAPLVGITSVNAVGDIQVTDANGVTYTAKATVGDDGDTIAGINVTSGNGNSALNRQLVDLASTGISISDLRNVNALQRWLEINMRRGLRYRDQVKSHYGIDIEYKELNMPEFIGGVSEDVIINRISQTVETEENPLGSLAGQGGVLGTSKHDISHYCDEKGFIIGILSIAPVPNYSQNIPKHLLKSHQLDYYTPEFAHIGMQPILNSEVTPLQANLEGKLNDVFGYQRPWYDYLASTDEVHGEFRNTMRRYLINRVYDGTPELGSEFLTIDHDTINDVFAVTSDTDKIYGQIYFDVTAKRPIAANVTPKIEP